MSKLPNKHSAIVSAASTGYPSMGPGSDMMGHTQEDHKVAYKRLLKGSREIESSAARAAAALNDFIRKTKTNADIGPAISNHGRNMIIGEAFYALARGQKVEAFTRSVKDNFKKHIQWSKDLLE